MGPVDGLQQPGKWISVFITPAQGRSSKKRAWLKAFLIFLTDQGGRMDISDGRQKCQKSWLRKNQSECPGAKAGLKLQKCGKVQ